MSPVSQAYNGDRGWYKELGEKYEIEWQEIWENISRKAMIRIWNPTKS